MSGSSRISASDLADLMDIMDLKIGRAIQRFDHPHDQLRNQREQEDHENELNDLIDKILHL